MKRIITLLLVLTMTLGLCACQGGNTEETNATAEGLQVGYNRQSITPKGEGVPMAGFANDLDRISAGFIDYIYTTCIAFTEGDNTVLLFTDDLMGMGASAAKKFGQKVSEATGVPAENIIFCDTHTHYSPSIITKTPAAQAYYDFFADTAVTAAQQALADRAPTTLYAAKVQTEGMNFTRHYLQSDGKITSSNTGNLEADKVIEHAKQADPEMVLIKMDRADESKKDIVLMNFQAHPTSRGGADSTAISADYIGTARTAFEEQTGMEFAFFQGASGDLVTDSRLTPNNLDCEAYGAKLAEYAVNALDSMQKMEQTGVQSSRYQLNFACNHFGEEKMEDAKKVYEIYEQTKNNAAATTLAQQLGMTNWYEARGIVNCEGNPDAADMELNALCIGGIAFVSVPWEMFTETGKYLKANSPYEFTVVLGLANGKTNYVPTQEAFEYGCYESYSAYYGVGAAEAAAEQLLTMLKSFQ